MISAYKDKTPVIPDSVFIAGGAYVFGDVEIGEDSGIWFNSVVRGDVNYIRIGERTSIQDLTMVHSTRVTNPTFIGSNVTVGHRVVLHGCTIGDYCLIGMGSVILDGVEIGDRSMVAAGSVVSPGTKIEPRTLAMGVPAKPCRELNEHELKMLEVYAQNYVDLRAEYLDAKN